MTVERIEEMANEYEYYKTVETETGYNEEEWTSFF